MGRGYEKVFKNILLFSGHSDFTLATPVLSPKSVQRTTLDVAAPAHGHRHLFDWNQVFLQDVVLSLNDFSASFTAIILPNVDQFIFDNI